MRLFEGTYLKKDGSSRTMRFVKLDELPTDFLNKVSKGGKGPKLAEGLESVWDVDKNDFRVFNHNTLQTKLTVTEVKEEVLSTNR